MTAAVPAPTVPMTLVWLVAVAAPVGSVEVTTLALTPSTLTAPGDAPQVEGAPKTVPASSLKLTNMLRSAVSLTAPAWPEVRLVIEVL